MSCRFLVLILNLNEKWKRIITSYMFRLAMPVFGMTYQSLYIRSVSFSLLFSIYLHNLDQPSDFLWFLGQGTVMMFVFFISIKGLLLIFVREELCFFYVSVLTEGQMFSQFTIMPLDVIKAQRRIFLSGHIIFIKGWTVLINIQWTPEASVSLWRFFSVDPVCTAMFTQKMSTSVKHSSVKFRTFSKCTSSYLGFVGGLGCIPAVIWQKVGALPGHAGICQQG